MNVSTVVIKLSLWNNLSCRRVLTRISIEIKKIILLSRVRLCIIRRWNITRLSGGISRSRIPRGRRIAWSRRITRSRRISTYRWRITRSRRIRIAIRRWLVSWLWIWCLTICRRRRRILSRRIAIRWRGRLLH